MMKMPHWPVPLGKKPINLGLNRVGLLLEALGNPQKKLPPVVHVAGTNGKGSTVAFTKAIFEAAGYKVHTYTSPHLLTFNERIKILGSDIEDNFLYEVLEECRIATEKLGLEITFFEGTTAAAFLAFSLVPADIVILEVGLGGRLDATNVIEPCAMSVITSIDFDHMDFLGNSLESIAFEKSGIIKPNCPVVVSAQYPEVMEVIFKQSQRMNSPSLIFEYDWLISPGLYQSKNRDINLPELSLKGDHQYLNAGNAITVACNIDGFTVKDEDIIKGLKTATWPARLQLFECGEIVKQFNNKIEFWVDGAHNQSAALVLSNWLKEQNSLIPTYLVFGMTRGRDCKAFLAFFDDLIEHVIGVLIENEPSSYSGEYVSTQAKELGFDSSSAENLEQAIEILKKIIDKPCRVLVCGSLYLAGEFIHLNK